MIARSLAVILAIVSSVAAQQGPPLVDGEHLPFEWKSSWVLFDTGPRGAGGTGFLRTGLTCWAGWDQDELFLGLRGYPAAGLGDGPLATFFVEVRGTQPPRYLGRFHDDLSGAYPGVGDPWPAGMVSLRGGTGNATARMSAEISIPWAELGLDPYVEAFDLHLRVDDGDGSGGYDTFLSASGGYVVPPPTSMSGYTRVSPSAARFIGRTKPRFAPLETVTALGSTGRLQAHDLDGNGRDEILVARPGAAEITVFERQGNAYLVQDTLGGMTAVSDLQVADLDADGEPDLVVADGNAQLHVFRGQGLGLLGFHTTIVVPRPVRVFAHDLEGDGDLDLFVLEGGSAFVPGGLHLVRNLGGASFAAPVPIGVLGAPRDLLVHDFDLDGRPDVVVCDAGNVATSPSLVLFRNLLTWVRSDLGSVEHPVALALEDCDGDGREDVLVTDLGDLTTTGDVWFVEGGGPLGLLAPQPLGLALAAPGDIASFDLGGDRDLDLVVHLPGRAEVLVLEDFDGTSFVRTWYPLAPDSSPQLVTGDLDGDGFVDLLFAALAVDEVQVRFAREAPELELYGQGCPGTFGPPVMGWQGEPSIGGNTFEIGVSQVPAFAFSVLHWSFGAGAYPLGGGCTALIDLVFFQAIHLFAGPTGEVGVPFSIPLLVDLAGASMYWQWGIADPNGPVLGAISFSAGLRTRFGFDEF